MKPVVSELYIYPVKSCSFVPMQELRVDEWGPIFDRHWMIVDKDGKFLTQRKYPKMALIQPTVNQASLTLDIQNQKVDVPFFKTGPEIDVVVWDDTTRAIDCGKLASEFISDFLGEAAKLVQKGPHHKRTRSHKFSDGYPFLLMSDESLQDLNNKMPTPLPALRFRPNIVVKGCEPYAEDKWSTFTIGDVKLERVKDCARCPITTVDFNRGQFSGPEPLKTLAQYRRGEKNKVLFAQNLIHHNSGKIRLSDSVMI